MNMSNFELVKHLAETYDASSNDPNTQILIKEIDKFITEGTITTTKQIDDYKQL